MENDSKAKSTTKEITSEDKNTIFYLISTELKDWCLSTSVHGFSKLISSRNWLKKIIWFSFIAFFAYNSMSSIFLCNINEV